MNHSEIHFQTLKKQKKKINKFMKKVIEFDVLKKINSRN